MFYDEKLTMEACEEEPSQIFNLVQEDFAEIIDKLLTKKIVDINIEDENGNSIVMCLLKKGWYELVLKHMKNKEWDVNHQNKAGDTFAHILVTKKYLEVMDIIKQLLKNKNFIPNMRNKEGQTILDKSISANYIYTTVKILEDERFNNIDLVSFKNLYEKYIKSSNYGAYSKITNLEVIIDNLVEKQLLPKVEQLINKITSNYETIKNEVKNNQMKVLDNLIYQQFE